MSSPPPPSSDSPATWEHGVFLCFRGEDTREGFTSHLFQALDSRGIDTFIDDRLPKGRSISELLDRIETSRVSVVVFSENFASSRWCLDELVKILECRERLGQEVLPVFYKVPPSELRDLSKGKTGEYLAKHGEKYCDGYSEKIEAWRLAVRHFADLNGWHYSQGIESRLVSEIVKTVQSKLLDVKITGEPPASQVTHEVDNAGGSPAGTGQVILEDFFDVQNEKQRGDLGVELVYKPFKEDEIPKDSEDPNAVEKAPEGTPTGGGLLAVIVHEAQDVEGKHHTNPQVRLLFRGDERKTKIVKKNRRPRWEEEFWFMLEEPPTHDRIHLEVISTSSRLGLLHPKETLGYVDIYLSDVVSNKRINGKYNLIDSNNGQIQVELQWRAAA